MCNEIFLVFFSLSDFIGWLGQHARFFELKKDGFE